MDFRFKSQQFLLIRTTPSFCFQVVCLLVARTICAFDVSFGLFRFLSKNCACPLIIEK